MRRTTFRDQAHPIRPEPQTLGDLWDAARRDPRQTFIDFAAALLIVAVGLALYVLLWGMQP